MGYGTIIEKLRAQLRKPIELEQQVVYMLVQIRKLLESQNLKKTFPVLVLYADWVVHAKLTRSSVAREIIEAFEEWCIRIANGQHLTLQDAAYRYLNEIALRAEMRSFLEFSELPVEICTDAQRWGEFRSALVSTIEGIPLEAPLENGKPASRFIKSVAVTSESTGEALIVRWNLVFHTNPVVDVVGGVPKLRNPSDGSNRKS
jgi:hypothetical protein